MEDLGTCGAESHKLKLDLAGVLERCRVVNELQPCKCGICMSGYGVAAGLLQAESVAQLHDGARRTISNREFADRSGVSVSVSECLEV